MDENDEPHKLFRDILNFEKQYKSNLTQLKIMEEEIKRNRAINKVLQDTITSNMDEIRSLKIKLRNSEDVIRNLQGDRLNETRVCEEIVCKLIKKINSIKTEHEENVVKLENLTRRRCNELEASHRKLFNDQEKEYSEKVNELKSNLQTESIKCAKLGKQISNLIANNLALHNKNREIESRYVPEISIHKNEIKTVKLINAKLKKNLEILHHDCELNRINLTSSEETNRKLKIELNEKNLQLDEIRKETFDMNTNLVQLTQKLELCSKMNKELVERCETLENCKQDLEHKNEQLILSLQSAECGLNASKNFNSVIQQNNILREIIKTYRKSNEDKEENNIEEVTNKRLDQLEDLLMQLKQATFEHFELHG